jgi:ubiquinone/menaquinone biosynthesis C-methylase UbiE
MIVVQIIAWIIGVFIAWQLVIRIARKLIHFPAPPFIGRVLDSHYRRKLQPPDKLIERSGIKPGMRILEVGCGSGAYTTFTAVAVGDKGKVYGLDIQEKMLHQLEAKLHKPEHQHIRNIELLNASVYEIPLEDNCLDLVYMITVLQEIPDKQKALGEIKRVLKPGGIIAVSEFLPDPDYPLKSTTVKDLVRAGFQHKETAGNLWNYTVCGVKEQ